MVVWSALRHTSRIYCLGSKSLLQNVVNGTKGVVQKRMSGHGNMFPMESSRWQFDKFKDLMHYYIMVGAIPIGCVIFFSNVFVGPAQLAEIPEGYTPKHWEYYKHPITRFLARYVYNSYQQEYEKRLHYLYEEDEKAKIRLLVFKIQNKMQENQDYQAYFYIPVTPRYHKISKEVGEKFSRIAGEN